MVKGTFRLLKAGLPLKSSMPNQVWIPAGWRSHPLWSCGEHAFFIRGGNRISPDSSIETLLPATELNICANPDLFYLKWVNDVRSWN